MADNDDYMSSKSTEDTVTLAMWNRLQEGINANRRYRLRAVAGGDQMRYSSTKVVWDTDIYIYFTRESDEGWVYNRINANPTTGIVCNDADVLYVVLNDTTATVLTVQSYDYTGMPTDDTGRIMILGAVISSKWWPLAGGAVLDHATEHHTGGGDLLAHDSIPGSGSNAHSAIDSHIAAANPHSGSEPANANIQSHVAAPVSSAHHVKYVLTEDLALGEITQLQNVDATTISIAQWGYLGTLTESPQTHMSASNPHSGSASTTHTLDGHSASTLSANRGGTGQSAYVIGDILYANTTSTLAKLIAVASGDVLTSQGVGTAPAWNSPGAPGGHDLDSASHGDVSSMTEVKGDHLYWNGSAWSNVQGTESFGIGPYIYNGATMTWLSTGQVVNMPQSDANCEFGIGLRIPYYITTGSCKLKIRYSIPGTGAYSVSWTISAVDEGDIHTTESGNVLNNSTAYDFPGGTTNAVVTKTISLSDADIVPGGLLGIKCASDASNTYALRIHEVWIEA